MLLWEIIEARPIQLTPTTERGTSSLAELNAPLATQLNGHNVCAIQLAEHCKKFYITYIIILFCKLFNNHDYCMLVK